MNKVKFVKIDIPFCKKDCDGKVIAHYCKMTIAIDSIAALQWDKSVTTRRDNGTKLRETDSYSVQLKNGNEYTIDADQYDVLSKVLMMS